MASTFRGVIEFMNRIGLYDVVLPFLLVFTVVFAVLEKSKIFGLTKSMDGETDQPKKNLNAIVAFVVAFFVVASVRLVEILTEVSANIVLMMIFSFFFLVLVGMLTQDKDGISLEKGWKTFFYVIILIVMVLIFLGALGWLKPAWDWMQNFYNSEIVAGVVLLGIVVGFIFAVTTGKSTVSKDKD